MKTIVVLFTLAISLTAIASQKNLKKEAGLKELLLKANSLEVKQSNSKTQIGEKKEESAAVEASNSSINVDDSARELQTIK